MPLVEKQKPRILIVDDDKSVSVGLKEMLEERGFEIDTAKDGFEAGVLAIQKEPSLVILDLKMAGLDGFSTCRLFRENPLLKDVKILILTGYPSQVNKEKILKLGADRCVAKPVERKILLREINTLLHLKKDYS